MSSSPSRSQSKGGASYQPAQKARGQDKPSQSVSSSKRVRHPSGSSASSPSSASSRAVGRRGTKSVGRKDAGKKDSQQRNGPPKAKAAASSSAPKRFRGPGSNPNSEPNGANKGTSGAARSASPAATAHVLKSESSGFKTPPPREQLRRPPQLRRSRPRTPREDPTVKVDGSPDLFQLSMPVQVGQSRHTSG